MNPYAVLFPGNVSAIGAGSAHPVIYDSGAKTVTVDVTAAVSDWIAQRHPNQGFLFKSFNGCRLMRLSGWGSDPQLRMRTVGRIAGFRAPVRWLRLALRPADTMTWLDAPRQEGSAAAPRTHSRIVWGSDSELAPEVGDAQGEPG